MAYKWRMTVNELRVGRLKEKQEGFFKKKQKKKHKLEGEHKQDSLVLVWSGRC